MTAYVSRAEQAAETIYQALIEAELAWVIGPLPHERTGTRTANRNGHRPRTIATTAAVAAADMRS